MLQRGDQIGVRCVFMRGGTSRGAFLHAGDLPQDRAVLEALIVAIYGSPDFRQIDGLGGATPLTSKVGIVSRSTSSDFDVDFVFGQVRITEPRVDFIGNCGNLSAAIGPFAIDEGLVKAAEPETTLRIRLVNTGGMLVATVPVRAGLAATEGDVALDGVPGTGAGVTLSFGGEGGDTLGRGLLPTGRARERLKLTWGEVDVSVVDAANPVVFARMADVGLDPAEVGQPMPGDAIRRLLEIRGEAAVLLGLAESGPSAEDVSPAIPKVYAVAEPADYIDSQGRTTAGRSVNAVGRGLTMGSPHATYAATCAICTAVAAALPGTVVSAVAVKSDGSRFRIGHPSGRIEVEVKVDASVDPPALQQAAIVRTARRIMDGIVWVPVSRLRPAPG